MKKQAQDKKLEPESLHATAAASYLSFFLPSLMPVICPSFPFPSPSAKAPFQPLSHLTKATTPATLLTPVRNNLKEHVLWFVM